MIEAGVITMTAFISPFKKDRKIARNLMLGSDFIEVYCYCSLEVCEKRDTKGLYKKARNGDIKNFTGITSSYEAPIKPELKIDTHALTLEESVQQVLSFLRYRGIIQDDTILKSAYKSAD